ncbi:MAG: hypothetical protein HY865_00035, partial [Chloroflexi bacterium]|nr:hypothetical protein [Chloroflexota bacterium]
MQNIAAIDVGSNAMRMVVGRIVYDGKVEVVENLRLPVRLGQDAFTTGIISEQTAQRTVDAFTRFRGVADHHKVEKVRAIATSAMREASNCSPLKLSKKWENLAQRHRVIFARGLRWQNSNHSMKINWSCSRFPCRTRS